MKLEILTETARGLATLQMIINYLSKRADAQFLAVPGIEHFKNPEGLGFGVRYNKKGSMLCIRFNWRSLSAVGRPFAISSVDIFTGKGANTRLPSLNFKVDGIPLVKALPSLAAVIISQRAGTEKVLPVDACEVVTEMALTESIKGIMSFKDALDGFLASLKSGKTYSRKDFAQEFGGEHIGIYDAIEKQFKAKLDATADTIAAKDDTDFSDIRDKILSSAATVEVVKVTGKESLLPNKQEEAVKPEDNISYEDTLEHMSSLVDALVKGSFNALFIIGKGGCLSGDTSINVIIKQNDSYKAQNAIKN